MSPTTLTRVALAGWVGWTVLAVTVWTTAVAAALQRWSSVCGAEGLAHPRAWEFQLLPLGQTCAGEATAVEAFVRSSLTAAAVLAAFVGLAAVGVTLVRSRSTAMPSSGCWLLYGVVVGTVAAVVTGGARAASGIPFAEPPGVSLGVTMLSSLAFALGLTATAVAGLISSGRRSTHDNR